MFKLIWKNLWARRRKNGWLLAELILVSIISWVVLDPVIVVTHDRNIRWAMMRSSFCLISLGALQPQAPGYDAEAQDSAATLVDNYYNLVRYVKDFDGVESATPVLGFCYPNSSGEVRIVNCLPKGIRFPFYYDDTISALRTFSIRMVSVR